VDKSFQPPRRTWVQKFQHGFAGIAWGVRGQSSFVVHFTAATLVVLAAASLQMNWARWCVLLLCITLVLTAELFNSALEQLAKAIDRSENERIATALDIGSAAVLMASLGASAVGLVVLLTHLLAWGGPEQPSSF
jgi:diacylglycerol kinase